MEIIEKEVQDYKKTGLSKDEIINDYKLAYLNRQLSLIARKEVLSGKAKFGIFGDGKEIAQIAYAKQFRNGDWRSGYYRDNIFMMATGMSTPLEFFAQLYGDTNIKNNPSNGGRNFNNHYATRSINKDGSWKDLTNQKNSSSDLSPTAAQLPRLLGLAYASKLFRNNHYLKGYDRYSVKGNEVAFGTIGDAATAEGHFFETVNAAGVLQVPMAIAIWDDGYGISVPTELQTTKGSISEILKGFVKEKNSNGIIIYKVKGWDYPSLVQTFKEGIKKCRKEHIPVVFHVEELTQPIGHSTSGSHERYKSEERLIWEKEWDAIKKMEEWMVDNRIVSKDILKKLQDQINKEARHYQKKAWQAYIKPIKEEKKKLIELVRNKDCECNPAKDKLINDILEKLELNLSPTRSDLFSASKKVLRNICSTCVGKGKLKNELNDWITRNRKINSGRYNTLLHCESKFSALKVKPVSPSYPSNPELLNGREIIRNNFDILFKKYPLLVTFGEDSGKLGDVNKGLEGLQDKYGDLRVTDTGIRETTIIGQGIGLALRGMKPIAEIQYFDYLLYGLQTLSDDLASLHYRTAGGQVAPLIIRTRGHRLEGIWHSGSPLSMVINSIRGIYVCVPRNMTQAAGFYNTLLEGHDPALVIEPLRGYNLKERKPGNLGEYKIPLGKPEIVRKGKDITIVSYGWCVHIALEAASQLAEFNISVEVIDVQTLLPFDIDNSIVESIKKTNKVLFFDEDVPGGATAFMMQKVIEDQEGYRYLDTDPKTLTAHEHRPAYSSDGDYFSNPNAEDVFETIYGMMHDYDLGKYPGIF